MSDLLGRQVAILLAGTLPAGSYENHWNGLTGDGRSLPSGLYFSVLKVGAETDSRKMLLLK